MRYHQFAYEKQQELATFRLPGEQRTQTASSQGRRSRLIASGEELKHQMQETTPHRLRLRDESPTSRQETNLVD